MLACSRSTLHRPARFIDQLLVPSARRGQKRTLRMGIDGNDPRGVVHATSPARRHRPRNRGFAVPPVRPCGSAPVHSLEELIVRLAGPAPHPSADWLRAHPAHSQLARAESFAGRRQLLASRD